jgi:dGTPase
MENKRLPQDPKEQIAKLRAVAIGKLVDEVSQEFWTQRENLLSGEFAVELLSTTRFAKNISNAKSIAAEKIYKSEKKIKLEIMGNEVISGLLDIFTMVPKQLKTANFDASRLKGRAADLARLMRPSLVSVNTSYAAMLAVTDFISGMTDRYALDLYRNLKGISA